MYQSAPLHFNPLPRKEGDLAKPACSFVCMHFNPLPRKEGDRTASVPVSSFSISIHSLVKRETSILRLPILTGYYFNPLPRKEGDITRQGIQKMRILISIHSLVKRETHDKMHVANFPGYFNPLPRKEGDRRGLKQRKLYQLFQSTPSYSGRRLDCHCERELSYFIPLPLKVVYRRWLKQLNLYHLFQSTPS